MIDFRYHLVSIVSIFMALAVGIVLGAGPLKEDIGNTLTSEVTKLREDKTSLRSELDEATTAAKARDDFVAAGNKVLLADRISGTSVAVVVLPGASADLVTATTSTLTDAGATIGSTVTVLDAWVDPQKEAFRSTLAQQLAPTLGLPSGGDGALIDRVLATAVLGAGAPADARELRDADAGSGAPEGAGAALGGLRTGELVTFSPADPAPAQAAVVVTGPTAGDDAGERERRAAALRSLAAALDEQGRGTVVVAGAEDQAEEKDPGGGASVVEAVRADDATAEEVSTVDNAGLPMGQASVIFALLEQLRGEAGQYGLAASSAAAFPEIPGS